MNLPPALIANLSLAQDSERNLLVILIIGLAVLTLGAILAWYWKYEKKRTEKFHHISQELGLLFLEKGDPSLQGRLKRFYLFSQGRSKKIRNLLRVETGDLEMAMFDYRFSVGSGQNSRTERQSVVYIRSSTLQLPQFALRPEGMFHKIGAAFGYQDIDFEEYPEFSKAYLLRGRAEREIRSLFDDRLLKFLENEKKISVEGEQDQLIYYRRRKRLQPEDVKEFMQEGYRIFSAFGGRSKE